MALVLKCFASTNSIVFGWLKFSFEQATFRALTVELAGAFPRETKPDAVAALIHGKKQTWLKVFWVASLCHGRSPNHRLNNTHVWDLTGTRAILLFVYFR
jgi:hypothetical protein